MSPKKSVKNQRSKRKSTEKLQNKKEKPEFNMPTNIKVSIPIRNNIGNTEEGIHFPIVRGKRPPQFKKHLDTKTQLDLANTVARQQLIKEEPPIFQLDNIVIIQKPMKKGRKRKNTDYYDEDVAMEHMDNNAENIVTSTDTKSQKIKVPTKPTITRRIVTRKRLADSTANSQPTSSKKAKVDTKLPKTEIIPEKPIADDDEIVPDSKPIPNTSLPQVKPAARRGRSAVKPLRPRANKPAPKCRVALRRGSKGKQENADPSNKLPPIPDQPKTSAKIDTETENAQQCNSAPIDSRKTSVSSCSNLSWTKDISSSSNTTCITACSNDFVRINKKLPMLVLNNIDNDITNKLTSTQQLQNRTEVVPPADPIDSDDSSSDFSDSDDSDSEENYSDPINDIIDGNSINLSTSSQPSSRIPDDINKQNSKDYTKITDTLIMLVEKLDMEIINWISSDNEQNNANLVKFKDKMFDILDDEFGVITHCSRLKHILDPDNTEDAAVECIPKIVERAIVENKIVHKDTPPTLVKETTKAPEKDFVEPRPLPLRKSSINLENYASSANAKVPRDEFFEDDMHAVTSKNNYSYDHHDDDDALSLFAESITGFESSRMNTSIVSYPAYNARPVEEYIPRPVTEISPSNVEKHTYLPTKIADAEVSASKIKSVIEKQNADSTSIYKQSNSTEDADAESYEDFSENIELNARVGPSDVEKTPRLMDNIIERNPRARSIVFSNLCFYNLLNCCRKVYSGQCRFLHVIPTCEQIKAKLSVLDERLLIQEYMLLRNWTEIRRRFGMCYVEECAKRGLTRILVEMAYDFIVKARNDSEEDTRIRVNTIEITLLHLNSVDLCICEDLLKLPVHAEQGNKTLLCDVFMATMSITQNFSRFKIVFLTLTYFMVDNDRTFNKDVVEHILERVCILPFEEPIAKALIQMMRLTNCAIFNNSMIGMFEKQISVNKDVLEEYMLLKNQYAFSSMLASSMIAECSQLKLDKPQSVQSDAGDGQPPAASPDTTNISNQNQPSEEPPVPVITRTISMGPPITFNHSPTKQSPFYGQENPRGPRPTFVSPNDNNTKKYWRHRSIFNNIMRPPTVTPRTHIMRPPMLPQMRSRPRPNFNQRLVTFRSPSSYMNRPPGPKYSNSSPK
ncbi:uncharacterized protein LOC111359968 isoform X3 [Spodoptera litura]|uniref:Uncharacterized protein LOC111359968 isoform X3 n=1 Tax=Spodoptera litura TaxID=69820 RepID=A0A9J7EI70_SPOLT|nr:uncharacterized protein LOC111359968 isoform X3 [Spodoptera litura]